MANEILAQLAQNGSHANAKTMVEDMEIRAYRDLCSAGVAAKGLGEIINSYYEEAVQGLSDNDVRTLS